MEIKLRILLDNWCNFFPNSMAFVCWLIIDSFIRPNPVISILVWHLRKLYVNNDEISAGISFIKHSLYRKFLEKLAFDTIFYTRFKYYSCGYIATQKSTSCEQSEAATFLS